MFYFEFLYIPKEKTILNNKNNSYSKIVFSKKIWFYTLITNFVILPYWVFIGTSSILFIRHLGVSSYQYSVYKSLISLCFACSAFCCAFLISYIDVRKVLSIGLLSLLIFIMLALYVITMDNTNVIIVVLSVCILTIGHTFIYNIMVADLLDIFPNVSSSVMAFSNSIRFILLVPSIQIVQYFGSSNIIPLYTIMISYIFLSIVMFMVLFGICRIRKNNHKRKTTLGYSDS